jgi:hypothetical protein
VGVDLSDWLIIGGFALAVLIMILLVSLPK